LTDAFVILNSMVNFATILWLLATPSVGLIRIKTFVGTFPALDAFVSRLLHVNDKPFRVKPSFGKQRRYPSEIKISYWSLSTFEPYRQTLEMFWKSGPDRTQK
jgi:hypothetical protein